MLSVNKDFPRGRIDCISLCPSRSQISAVVGSVYGSIIASDLQFGICLIMRNMSGDNKFVYIRTLNNMLNALTFECLQFSLRVQNRESSVCFNRIVCSMRHHVVMLLHK